MIVWRDLPVGVHVVRGTSDGLREQHNTSPLLQDAGTTTDTVAVASVSTQALSVDLGTGIGMGFLWVSQAGRNSVEKQHEVACDCGFWMGKTEVTRAQWKAVMGNIPACLRRNVPNAPVACVTWVDCKAFCKRLNEDKRLKGLRVGFPCGEIRVRFRLPTEEEWEYAARGGTESRGYIYAGSDNADLVAWHSGNSGDMMHPVGAKQPNELGLYDMSGNVEEWCLDTVGYLQGIRIRDKYRDEAAGAHAWESHVIRGGCWTAAAKHARLTARHSLASLSKGARLGFRVCLVKESKVTDEE